MRTRRWSRSPRAAFAAPAALLSFSILIQACHDNTQPGAVTAASGNGPVSGGIDVRKIRLAYVCGNTFKVSNFNTAQVLVTYSIRKTGEQGNVTLPAAPGGDPNYSET